MSTVPGLVAAAVGLLLAGVGIGYWVAQFRAGKTAARAEDVQQKFDDYRRDVTDHFGRTAAHFQSIGEQYRELYEHMASGAESLCDRQHMDEQLSFAPLALSRGSTADAADSAPKDYPEAADAGPASDASKPGVDATVADEDAAGEAESDASRVAAEPPDLPASAGDAAEATSAEESAAPRDYADEDGLAAEEHSATDTDTEARDDDPEPGAKSGKEQTDNDAQRTYH